MLRNALHTLVPRLSGLAVGFLASIVVLTPANVMTLEAALAGIAAVALDVLYSITAKKP